MPAHPSRGRNDGERQNEHSPSRRSVRSRRAMVWPQKFRSKYRQVEQRKAVRDGIDTVWGMASSLYVMIIGPVRFRPARSLLSSRKSGTAEP